MNQTARTFDEFFAAVRNEPVYVILGVQGAGTNLLGRLLVKTFSFSLIRDRSMIFNAAAGLGPSADHDDIARAFGHIESRLFPSTVTRKFAKGVIRQNEPFTGIREHFERTAISTAADLARFVYAYRAYSSGTTRMLIKSDDLWERIDAIDRVLPNRRIILLTRDFRDNLVSVSGKSFGPIEAICAAEYVRDRFVHYDREYRRSGVSGFHVKYEALLDSPAETMHAFARHFSLAPSVSPEEALATFPIRPNKTRKWAALSARDLAWCEAILHDHLTSYGYTPATAQPRPPAARDWAAARLRDVVKRVPQKIRKLREQMAR